MSAPAKASKARVALLVLLAAFLVAAVGVGIVSQGHPSNVVLAVMTVGWPRHFTADAWQAHPGQRYYMVFDLAKSSRLRGKSTSQLIAMLGRPGQDEGDMMVWPVSYPHGPATDALVVWTTNGVVSGWSTSADTEMGPQYH